jgi:hypothetical protein
MHDLIENMRRHKGKGIFIFISIFLILKISQIYTKGKKIPNFPISFVEKKIIPKETLVSAHAWQIQILPAVLF